MTSLFQKVIPEVQRSIESNRSFWRIYSTDFQEKYGIPAIDLSRKVLPDLSQEKHIEYTCQAHEKGEFCVASMPVYHSIFRQLYSMKDSEQYGRDVEQTRKFLERAMNEYDLVTLTHVYIPKRSPDRIVHDVSLKTKKEIRLNITYLSDRESLDPPEVCEAVLGSSDSDEAHEIYSWLRPDREPRFSLPDQRYDYERKDIVAFQDNTSWGIIGTASFNWVHHALGVRFVTPLVLQMTQKKAKKARPVLPFAWQGKDIEIEPNIQRVYGEDELNHRLALAEQGGHLSPERASIVRKILLDEGESA